MGVRYSKPPGHITCRSDGRRALDWLFQRSDFADAPRPDLVLLDLNLPAAGWQEILEEIKSDPLLKRIPVVVLTSSQVDDDLRKAYDASANACMRKPVGPEDFADHIQQFVGFWISTAVLPPSDEDN
ncbi:response regulator [Natrinema sp. 1APR25-10V2]|uniref:response regulator n=1 Tax=Natrinema sp. 1APR25-10V2 TaxID=2951081 RepID=UPI00287B87A3|nr:response regulator [Natrinema sp. 1APR25-10V2]